MDEDVTLQPLASETATVYVPASTVKLLLGCGAVVELPSDNVYW